MMTVGELETTPETTLPIEENMQGNFFDANYRTGGDSGSGSLVSSTVTYRYIIESFIRLNDVHSVLDLGCGDWQFSKLIPWDYYDIAYLGLDISPFIIEKNRANFGTERRQFKVISRPSDIFGLGRFDLVICKDALQHIPNGVVNEYLDAFVAAGRCSLITNDAFTSDSISEDMNSGDLYRPIDIRKPPFSRNSSVIAEYISFKEGSFGHIFYIKHVHLLTGNNAAGSR
jgi:SAM-dependent methyltransferase